MKLNKPSIHIGISSLASNGKTILAQHISDHFGMPYEGNFTRKLAEEKKHKLNKSHQNNFNSDQLQLDLFDFHKDWLYKHITKQTSFVTDRTVYDYLMYAYCFNRNKKQLSDNALKKCIEEFINMYHLYDVVIILPPIKDYKVIEDSSARDGNLEYQLETWKILEMMSFLYNNDKVYIPINNNSWDERELEIFNFLKEKYYV